MTLFQPWDELGVDHGFQLQHLHPLGGPQVQSSGLGDVIRAVQHTLVVVAVEAAAISLQSGVRPVFNSDWISIFAL